jgi:putative ATP-dependent endonuclease of OLD family
MYLRTIEVSNFLSLEQARLEHLGQFNVLIGRNNSGKSAVFNALAFLGRVALNQSIDRQQDDAILTDRDQERSLTITLTFELRPPDREEFLGLLQLTGAQRNRLRDSPFCRTVEYTFKAPLAHPVTSTYGKPSCGRRMGALQASSG